MKKYKEVVTQIPSITKTDRKLVDIVCDICGESLDSYHSSGGYNTVETVVKLTEGDNWPEGGSGKIVSYDICADCFKQHIIPLAESLGAKPTIEEWDY